MSGITMEIQQATRACTVKGEPGYFHCWEQYSQPLGASPIIYSRVFGIVEFCDGVRRIDPTEIIFCDEYACTLKEKNNQNEASIKGGENYASC